MTGTVPDSSFEHRPARAPAGRLRTFSWIIVCLLGLAACTAPGSPEEQIREVLRRIETAAESREAGDLVEHLSESYRDAYGHGREDVARTVRGYFIANQSIHLLTRLEDIQFPSSEEARVKVAVGMLGREAGAEAGWDLAADIYHFDLAFIREDGDWKVLYASW